MHCAVFFASLLAGFAQLEAAESISQQFGCPVVSPESVGFSSARLARLDAAIQRTIDGKSFAGVVTVAARHGRIFQCQTYGWKDLATHAPMASDAIFRLHSMTKPITGVAMMMLYEEGKWHPQDPISRYIPEFAHLKVFKGYDAAGHALVEEPEHAPTMRELMTHTAGFASGQGHAFGDQLYQDARGENRILAPTLPEMIRRLSETPLAYQPGTRWLYSISTEIQGYLVEKLSGQSFPDFVRQRICEPLGMQDTAFYVPAEKRGRLASYYERTAAGELRLVADSVGTGAQSFVAPPDRPSGSGGLVSTAPDYFRFAEMLRKLGESNGHRLLGPETVRMMSANHLGPELMSGKFGNGVHRMRPGLGFGFDCAVYTDPALADETTGKGTFMWLGAAGTIFWVDPTYDIVFVGMVQRQYDEQRPDLEELTRQTLYQALVRPEL